MLQVVPLAPVALVALDTASKSIAFGLKIATVWVLSRNRIKF